MLLLVGSSSFVFAQNTLENTPRESNQQKKMSLVSTATAQVNNDAAVQRTTIPTLSTEELHNWCRTYNVAVYSQDAYNEMTVAERAIVDALADKIIYQGQALLITDINRYKATK